MISPARPLTPAETATITTHAQQWLAVNDTLVGQLQAGLPRIPDDDHLREQWLTTLTGNERRAFDDLTAICRHLRPISDALKRGDAVLLLDLLTQDVPSEAERTARPDLYKIRDTVGCRQG